jgi:inner membrane protein
VIHPPAIPDELYQVSNRPDIGHQIISERITGKVGQRITTNIESVTWTDEEILPRLNKTIEREARHQGGRYPNAMMYLTGSIEIDDPEQIAILAKPQQLATVTKQGRKLEFNSCPLTVALNLLREQWGSGQVRIRVIVEN